MKRKVIWLAYFLATTLSCSKNDLPDRDFRQDMRQFVERIAAVARDQKPGFIVIPQNGQELITTDGMANGPLATFYMAAITGQAREDLFYGYTGDGIPTPVDKRVYMEGFLDRCLEEGKVILVTDYCSLQPDMLNSFIQNETRGYISFAADHRELDHVPPYPIPVFRENSTNIETPDSAKNFLYLIDPGQFPTRGHFIDSLSKTNYDLLIIDLFFDRDEQLSSADVGALKTKHNGSRRLVICYISIGEAENYRYYWKSGWEIGRPAWLDEPNPDWSGTYKVRYWDPAWQSIICGNDDSYLKRILDAGFDGVYLDVVDAFGYFEQGDQ